MNKRLLVGSAMLALVGAASAQSYASLSVGRSTLDRDCSYGTACDNRGSSYKVLGGYRLTPYFALEGVYTNYGKATDGDSDETLVLKAHGFGAGGAFLYDITPQWTVVARLGMARLKASYRETKAGALVFAASETHSQAYAGLGVAYRFSERLSLDAAWDVSQARIVGQKIDLKALSLGLTYAF